jgi:hypothetical protein
LTGIEVENALRQLLHTRHFALCSGLVMVRPLAAAPCRVVPHTDQNWNRDTDVNAGLRHLISANLIGSAQKTMPRRSYGMTGSRTSAHTLIEDKRHGVKHVVVAMCIGGGMCAAARFEVA